MLLKITLIILLGIILPGIILGLIIYKVFFKKPKDKSTMSLDRLGGSSTMSINGLDGKPKKWIFMLKLGRGGDNCTGEDSVYSCNFLYADDENPSIQYVTKFQVDSEISENPVYQFYTLCTKNKFVTWNDQGSIDSCSGASGWAHDKGGIVYNSSKTKGVYLQSSNPNWGFFDKGFLESGDASHPGIQTYLAQHFFFLQLDSETDIDNLVSLMNLANVCIMAGSIPGFAPCLKDKTCSDEYKSLPVNGLTMVAKSVGTPGDDVWGYLNKNICGDSGITVLSFCSPKCPAGNSESQSKINGVTDVLNTHHKDSDDWSVLNLDCDLKFSAFHSNHSKIGVCDHHYKVIVGGNNHSTGSQGPRGGLFVVIDDQSLARDLQCLFK